MEEQFSKRCRLFSNVQDHLDYQNVQRRLCEPIDADACYSAWQLENCESGTFQLGEAISDFAERLLVAGHLLDYIISTEYFEVTRHDISQGKAKAAQIKFRCLRIALQHLSVRFPRRVERYVNSWLCRGSHEYEAMVYWSANEIYNWLVRQTPNAPECPLLETLREMPSGVCVNLLFLKMHIRQLPSHRQLVMTEHVMDARLLQFLKFFFAVVRFYVSRVNAGVTILKVRTNLCRCHAIFVFQSKHFPAQCGI